MNDLVIRPWRTVELCAGVGGLGLGVHIAEPGSRCIAYVEREAYAAAVLAARMEAGDLAAAAVWSDIATFDAGRMRGAVDCVISGDPCQPNSVAGKRGGADDERFLIDQVVRIFDESGADRLFRENVTGNADGQLSAIVPALERLGCRVAAGIFSAAEAGASHRRERLFIMADREGQRSGKAGEFRRDGPPHRPGRCGATVADAAHRDGGRRERGTQAGIGQDGERGRRFAVSAADCLKQLGEPNCEDPQGRWPDAGAIGRQEPPGSAGLSGGTVGYSPCERRGKGRAEPILWSGRNSIAGDGLPIFAPGPADPRWAAIIADAPHLEPALCRMAHGLADRVDSLRACGNGVFPMAAALAWLSLDALLAEARVAGAAAMMGCAA